MAAGLTTVAVFPVLIAALQGMVGFPLTSIILRKEAILPLEWAVCLGVGFLIAGIVWFVAARLYHREQLAISG